MEHFFLNNGYNDDVKRLFRDRFPGVYPLAQSTVYELVTTFQETGSVADFSKRGRPPVSENQTFQVKEKILMKSSLSCRHLAPQVNLLHMVVH